MNLKDKLTEKLNVLSTTEFNYIETNDISRAATIDLDNSGIYVEASIIYFEIKNVTVIMKENGRRKMAQAYTMFHEVLTAIAKPAGAFVNCFSPNAFLVIYPGKEESFDEACLGAMKIASAITQTFKQQFSFIRGLEFSMGLDHGHIMGSKNLSDNGVESITWFGATIYKAMHICKECSRPFYIGISGSIYHALSDELRVQTRRILGIKKRLEIWNKVTYHYENVKKHLYQTNHKISIDEEETETKIE